MPTSFFHFSDWKNKIRSLSKRSKSGKNIVLFAIYKCVLIFPSKARCKVVFIEIMGLQALSGSYFIHPCTNFQVFVFNLIVLSILQGVIEVVFCSRTHRFGSISVLKVYKAGRNEIVIEVA